MTHAKGGYRSMLLFVKSDASYDSEAKDYTFVLGGIFQFFTSTPLSVADGREVLDA